MAVAASTLHASGDALVLEGVTRTFGALRAIEDVSLSVAAGERRALIGANGAGKTTLFNTITGDFPPTAGRVRFFGEDVTAHAARTSGSAWACAARISPRSCSAISRCGTICSSPCAAWRAGATASCGRAAAHPSRRAPTICSSACA